MIKSNDQTFQAIEVIRVDGEKATWVDTDPTGLHCTPENFTESSGISIEQLRNYAETGEEFIIFDDEPPYMAGFEEPTGEHDPEQKPSTYRVYEFTDKDGSLRFFVDTSGDDKAKSPNDFTEWCGIPFVYVMEHARSGELLEIPTARPCYVRCFEVSREPNPRDDVLADLYDNIVKLRRMESFDRDHVLAALNRHLGELPEFIQAA
ncbi:hypothetical protein Q8W25_03625 [Shimia thalassica]|uniref:hypothetical protein n=1 Tax=Shimia thalassica TaxID=1715693 RepID=UPI0027345B64|nr:hypothetical protein [Shimia thalassica]MDP2493088.1 hypothetical protein [Shimia thalassica]